MIGIESSKVTFVILHYLVLSETQNCIKSIQNRITYKNYQIVIVDNGSNNGTGEKLIRLHADDRKIKVICLKKNIGFSAGNNIGYVYAREQLKSEYIIIINNDTEIIQKDFVEKAIECYRDSFYYVLGPDVINLEGVHQSPMKSRIMTEKEVKKWFIKRYLFSRYLRIHKKLNLPDNFIIYRKYIKNQISKKREILADCKQENVELQGSCLIFSPLYIERCRIAFEELTFLYGEETLLLLRCMKNNWRVMYNPDLKIRHIEKVATTAFTKNSIDKEIFYTDNQLKAILAILRQMK